MSEWTCKISKVGNGYTIQTPNEEDMVIQESENTKLSELEAIQDVLGIVAEYFGIHYSKHEKHNLSISITEEDKV